MAKISRNAPCPCGSEKKYKRCCLPLNDETRKKHTEKINNSGISTANFIPYFDDIDNISNSVIDLINKGRLDEAENVCHQLMKQFPDQIDGLDRFAEVYKARGNNKKAAEYYLKAADFAKNNSGFDQESIDWFLMEAKKLKSE